MAWQINLSETAKKQLSALDRTIQQRILKYLRDRVSLASDPRELGGPLQSNLSGLWKYRVGDYRIIAKIDSENFFILVVLVGHRRNIYGGH